ncbi:hypothetical protein CTI12_AA282850 [Artemisia annua]|uniref:Uncharacterized protein n=1 Tax=Artemisia annua TaxID=35608 RepID=A0A2U1NBW5_ARTAN|nr:hypothetical protein CTI12_AA282850 [Artemisia annua]
MFHFRRGMPDEYAKYKKSLNDRQREAACSDISVPLMIVAGPGIGKVKKGGMPPGPRAGFSMCVHKKRVVLFGGVVDIEAEGDVLMSLFLNERYGFQLDINRW